MKTIDFIISYIGSEATYEDRKRVKELLAVLDTPPLNPHEVISRMAVKAKGMYGGDNRLEVVKYVKELTGWGLKESKEWCDSVIFDVKHMQ